MNQIPANIVNQSQHRGLSVGLGLLDEALCEIAQWAEGREIHSTLHHEINNLDANQRLQILALIAQIRKPLSELAKTLHLTPRVLEASQRIRGYCAILWEQMCELESCNLNRYGEVPPGLADYLDPYIQEITNQMIELEHITSRKENQRTF